VPYLLRTNGSSSYVEIDPAISLPGHFRIEIDIDISNTGSDQKVMDSLGSSNRLDINITGSGPISSRNYCTFKVDGSAITTYAPFFGSRKTFVVERTSANSDQSTVELGTLFSRFSQSSFLTADFYGLKVYDASNTLISSPDPSATNGTGTELKDTTGSNDGELKGFTGTTDSWWHFYGAAFRFGCTITVAAGKAPSAQSNFSWVAVTANFPSAAIDGSTNSINDGGGNLRAYTDSSKGTEIPVEIVTFVTGGSPNILIWGKSPTINVGSTVYIEADTSATSQPAAGVAFGRDAVWTGDDARLHLGEAVNTASGGYIDSTGDFNGTGVSMALPAVSANFGMAQDFDGTNDRIEIPAGAISNMEVANKFLMSGWVNPDSVGSDGTILGRFGSNNSRQFLFYMDADGASPNYRLVVNGSGSTATATSEDSGGAVTEDWQLVHGVWDGTTASVYLNGSLNSTATGALTLNADVANIAIGSEDSGSTTRGLNGKAHNIRLASVLPSSVPDFIETEYNNQSNPASFWTTSAWENQDAGTETETLYSLNITSAYLQRTETQIPIISAYKELLESAVNIPSKYLERSSSTLDISSAYSERFTNTINIESAYQQRQINTLKVASAYTQRLTTTLSIESAYLERYSGALNITSVYLTDSSDTIYSLNIASKYLARSIGTLNIQSDYKERLIDSLNIASSYKQLEVETLSIESVYLQREQSALNITSGYQERFTGTLVITTKYNGEAVTIRRTPTVQVFITEASNSISITEPTTQITIIG
jgi:hypothetical protein